METEFKKRSSKLVSKVCDTDSIVFHYLSQLGTLRRAKRKVDELTGVIGK